MSTILAAGPGTAVATPAFGIWGVVLPVLVALAVSTCVWRWFPWCIGSVRDLARLRIGPQARTGGHLRLLAARGRPTPGITWIAGGTGLVLSWIVGLCLPSSLTGTWADLPLLAGFGLVAGVTGWLAGIDYAIHRLPNRVVLPLGGAMALLLVVSLLVAAGSNHGLPTLWQTWAVLLVRVFVCGAAFSAFFLLVALVGAMFKRDTMGMGDVKLAFPLGLLAGLFSPWGLLVALLVMNVSALVELGLRWAVTRVRPSGSLPFGPHMLLGTWTAVLTTGLLL